MIWHPVKVDTSLCLSSCWNSRLLATWDKAVLATGEGKEASLHETKNALCKAPRSLGISSEQSSFPPLCHGFRLGHGQWVSVTECHQWLVADRCKDTCLNSSNVSDSRSNKQRKRWTVKVGPAGCSFPGIIVAEPVGKFTECLLM